MKKLFAAIFAVIIALLSFAGCNETQEAVDQSAKLATDAAETVSDKVSDMMDSTDGDVTDGDGLIGDN